MLSDILGAAALMIIEVIKSNHLALKEIADPVAEHTKVMEELVQECPEQEVPVQGETVQEEPAKEELVQEELVQEYPEQEVPVIINKSGFW